MPKDGWLSVSISEELADRLDRVGLQRIGKKVSRATAIELAVDVLEGNVPGGDAPLLESNARRIVVEALAGILQDVDLAGTGIAPSQRDRILDQLHKQLGRAIAKDRLPDPHHLH